MNAEEYHNDHSRVGKTMLSHFIDSVEDYWHYYVGEDNEPSRPTSAMEVGSCVHEILLERKKPSDVCSLWPVDCLKKNGALNPKPAAEMREAYPNIRFMKQEQYDNVMQAVASVRNSQLGELLSMDGLEFEKPVFWDCQTTGLPCKCKPDFLAVMDHKIVIYDLKVSEMIRPRDFDRISKRLRYWLQDAHYTAAFLGQGKPVEFVFWVVEPKFPFRISPRIYSPNSRSNARSAYLHHMRRLANRYRTRDLSGWRDEWTQEKTLICEVSPWDVDADAEGELIGFDDE